VFHVVPAVTIRLEVPAEMEAQLQIRNNAQDAQEYMKDLYQWEKELKQKEESMQRNTQRAGGGGTSTDSSRIPLR
jgi:hypothetical protein